MAEGAYEFPLWKKAAENSKLTKAAAQAQEQAQGRTAAPQVRREYRH